LDIEQLNSGLYFITLRKSGVEIAKQKFVKE
jgi:hypothetical protein